MSGLFEDDFESSLMSFDTDEDTEGKMTFGEEIEHYEQMVDSMIRKGMTIGEIKSACHTVGYLWEPTWEQRVLMECIREILKQEAREMMKKIANEIIEENKQ